MVRFPYLELSYQLKVVLSGKLHVYLKKIHIISWLTVKFWQNVLNSIHFYLYAKLQQQVPQGATKNVFLYTKWQIFFEMCSATLARVIFALQLLFMCFEWLDEL